MSLRLSQQIHQNKFHNPSLELMLMTGLNPTCSCGHLGDECCGPGRKVDFMLTVRFSLRERSSDTTAKVQRRTDDESDLYSEFGSHGAVAAPESFVGGFLS